jgi:hypothetical protein
LDEEAKEGIAYDATSAEDGRGGQYGHEGYAGYALGELVKT